MVRNIIVLLFIIIGFYACHKGTRKSTTTEGSTSESKNIGNVVVDSKVDILNTGSPYKVDSLTISGDVLSVFVNYSGGCQEHSFELLSSGMHLKSLPPQIVVCLRHTNNDDTCRKLILQELKFNISALKYKGSDNTIVVIGDKQISYKK